MIRDYFWISESALLPYLDVFAELRSEFQSRLWQTSRERLLNHKTASELLLKKVRVNKGALIGSRIPVAYG